MFFFQSCIVIQGFIDAIIYGINEPSISCWKNFFFPKAFPSIEGSGHGHSNNIDNINLRTRFAGRSSRLDDDASGNSSLSLEMALAAGESAGAAKGSPSGGRPKRAHKQSAFEFRNTNGDQFDRKDSVDY